MKPELRACGCLQAKVYGWEEVGASLKRECGKQPGCKSGCRACVLKAVFAEEEVKLGEWWEELGIEGGAEVHLAWAWLYEGKLKGHTAIVRSVAGLGDGELASGSGDSTVRVWGADGQCERVLRGRTGGVLSVASLGGGRLASGSHDATVRVRGAVVARMAEKKSFQIK